MQREDKITARNIECFFSSLGIQSKRKLSLFICTMKLSIYCLYLTCKTITVIDNERYCYPLSYILSKTG